MKRFEYLFYVCAFALIAFATRQYTIIHFQNQKESAYRTPASIPPVFETESDLARQEQFEQKKILAGARTILESGKIGVTLGHFATRDVDGKSIMACDVYDRVFMTFAAEGVATSGNRPTLIIEGACEIGRDASQLDPLWLPVDDIKSKPPVDGYLQVTQPKAMTIKFEHMIDSWPTLWSLTEVKFYNKSTQKMLIIDSQTIYQLSNIRLSMVW